MDACDHCNATGAEPEDGITVCPVCRGKGEVVYQQSFISVRRTCRQCNGRGQIIRRPCTKCKGEAYIRRERKLKVDIPAGVDTRDQGAHLRAKDSRVSTEDLMAIFMFSFRSRRIRSLSVKSTICTARSL